MNAHVCLLQISKNFSEIKREQKLVRLQGDCICQQCDPPRSNIHVLGTERDVPTAGVGQLEDQPLPGSVPRLPVRCSRLLVQAPAKYRQRLGCHSVLARLVCVQHTVFEHEPSAFPTLTTTSPAQISRHLAA